MISYSPIIANDPVALAIAELPDWLIRAPWLHIGINVEGGSMEALEAQAKHVRAMPLRFATKVGRAGEEWPDCLPPMGEASAPPRHPLVMAPPEELDPDGLWPLGVMQAGWTPTVELQ